MAAYVEFTLTDDAFTTVKAATLRAGEIALKRLANAEGTRLVEKKLLGAMAHAAARGVQLLPARLGAMTKEAIADQLQHNFNVRQDEEGRVVVQLNQDGSQHSIAQSLFHAYGNEQLWHWPRHATYPLPKLIDFVQQAALGGRLSPHMEWMLHAMDQLMRTWYRAAAKQRSGFRVHNSRLNKLRHAA